MRRLAALRVPCYFAPVASPPDAGGSRYVGRVVDPDVREDGETEPEVELNLGRKRAHAASSPDALADQGEASPGADQPAATETLTSRGADVREKLLAKARAAEAKTGEPSSLDRELETIGRSPERPTADPVDFVASPPSGRAPSAPLTPNTPGELSPTLVAIFSALVGSPDRVVPAMFMNSKRGCRVELIQRGALLAEVCRAHNATVRADPSVSVRAPGPCGSRRKGERSTVSSRQGGHRPFERLEAAGEPRPRPACWQRCGGGSFSLARRPTLSSAARGETSLCARVPGGEEVYQAKRAGPAREPARHQVERAQSRGVS